MPHLSIMLSLGGYSFRCLCLPLLLLQFLFANSELRSPCLLELPFRQPVIGIGLGFIFAPSTPILAQWFSKRRSLVVGISSAGSGVGGLLFSFISQAMIVNVSLPWAFRITAAIVGVMNLTAVALIRNRNHIIRPPQLAFDRKLLIRYDAFLLLAWGFITMLGYITILYSLPDFAGSIMLSTSQAAAISAFLNMGTAVGRPLIGFASDRFGRIEVAGLFTFLCGLSCFSIWLPAKDYGVTTVFAIISGAVVGVFWMASPRMSFMNADLG
jgi:MFS family permease